jgi:predicted component of type VI protein secretion system
MLDQLPSGIEPSPWALRLSGGFRLRIPQCGLLIGRGSLCDLVLDDPDVSRRHLLITILAGKPWAIDQGSSNGSLIDGEAVDRRRLEGSHEILLGSARLSWSATDEDIPPLPPNLNLEWELWTSCLAAKRFAKDGLEILCRLGAAETARRAPHGGLALEWRDPLGAESLGPLRRRLLEQALRQAPT